MKDISYAQYRTEQTNRVIMKDLKWQKKGDNYKAEHSGYEVFCRPSGLGWIWSITKDGLLVDDCFRYSPPNGGELGCRVAAQRVLYKMLISEQNAKVSDTTTDAM